MLITHQLSLFLLNEHFGGVVEQCGKVLLHHGEICLEEYIQFAEKEQKLSEEDSRKGLGVLIHHHLISFSLPESAANQKVDPLKLLTNKALLLPQTEIKYKLDINEILIRIRFPHFIRLAEELGKDEASVLELICLHGPSSLQFLEEEYNKKLDATGLFHSSFNIVILIYFQKEKFIRKTKAIVDKRVVLPVKKATDIWEIDIPQVLNKLRYRACIKMVSDKIDSVSGNIAQCMINLATKSDAHGLQPDQHFFKVIQLEEALAEYFPEVTIDATTLLKYLEIMSNDYQIPMVSKSLNQPTYAINTDSILAVIQKKYIESIISEMLGPEAIRIYRMLQEFKFMEEDQVALTALIDTQDVRQILYKMKNYGFAQIQEVPRGNDYSAVKTFFLWYVDTTLARESVKEIVLNSVLKMKQRIKHERNSHKILLNKQSSDVQLSNTEKNILLKLSKIENVLHASIQRMADIFIVLQFYYTPPSLD